MYLEIAKIVNGFWQRGVLMEYQKLSVETTTTETFFSNFIHTKQALDYVLANKSLIDYNGEVMFNYLWVDIDMKNLKDSIKFAHNFIDNVSTNYEVSKDSFVIYFSGSKGFHIGLSASIFGRKFFVSDKIPAVCKMLVAILSGINPEDTDAMSASPIDFKIYYTVGVLRAPLSINKKSGAYKIRVSYDLIEDEDIETVMDNAMLARMSEVTYVEPAQNNKLAGLFDECFKLCVSDIEVSKVYIGSSNKNIFQRSTKTIFNIPKHGDRATDIYRMAYRLFQQPELLVDEVKDIMRIIFDATNLRSADEGVDAMKIAQLRTALDSAFRRTRAKGGDKIKIVAFEAIAKAAMSHVLNLKVVKSKLPLVDAIHGGMMLGNFYPVIGQRGTKKSFLLEDIAIENAIDDIAGIFFNLEMSETQLFKRGVQKIMNTNFFNDVQSGKVNNTNIDAFIAEMGRKLNSLLFVVSEPNLSDEQIVQVISQIENDYGKKMSYAMIDSFAGMAGETEELKKSIRLSKSFKRISTERNMVLFPICHVNQMCAPHIRDTVPYTRGGGKMADNADGYFCTSLIIDEQLTVGEDVRYRDNLLWVRYTDKRESGKVVDTIMSLDANLNLKPLEVDPSLYEVSQWKKA